MKSFTQIDIACAIDESFSYPLEVTLISIFEHHINKAINIHLFSASLSKRSINNFRQLTEDYNNRFQFYQLEEKIFQDFPISDRISYASYYRLLIPELIDKKVERFIYLDADIIVNRDLSSLLKIDLKDKTFGAVNDVAAIDTNMHLKHNIPDKYFYFNAGVLLIDRKKWSEKGFTSKVIEYLINNIQICDFHDQDALNGSLYEERFTISPIYNQQIGLFYINKEIVNKSYNEKDVEVAKKNPVIIHFNGREKPWHLSSAHPYQSNFNAISKKVKYFNLKQKPVLKSLIKKYMIYKIFGWSNVNRFYNNKAKENVKK